MSFIDDFKDTIDNYETNNCKTEIVNYSIIKGGTVLNVGEMCQFNVKVTNESHLDMKSVTVRAFGTSYADVALMPGLFGSYATFIPFNLDAHQNYTTGNFFAKAKAVTSGAKDIVTARINSWDASFDHLLKDHTGNGVAEGKLNKEIKLDQESTTAHQIN